MADSSGATVGDIKKEAKRTEELVWRQLAANEAEKLLPCLEALAAQHNAVSENFSGAYPARAHTVAIAQIRAALAAERSYVQAIATPQDEIIGFCQLDLVGDNVGLLHYLVLLPAWRGLGLGEKLLTWALAECERARVRRIEIKVAAGNAAAVKLYEKYGFRLAAQLFWR